MFASFGFSLGKYPRTNTQHAIQINVGNKLKITIIDKKEYLNKIKSGVFGGLPRKMKIEEIDQSGIIASAKLRIESSENDFISYNSLVLDTDNEWKIINNLAIVKAKK